MSWVRIDDSFEDHPKGDPLSDAAHRLWLRAACWCRKPANSHTFGFVPRGMLRSIAKNSAPMKELEKLALELVGANGDGMFEVGLWEVTEGGWRFHDWLDHIPRAPALPRWSTANYRQVFARDGLRCRYCGATQDLTIDHVVPRCLGGTDDADNLTVACRPCNGRKGGRTPEQAGMVIQ